MTDLSNSRKLCLACNLVYQGSFALCPLDRTPLISLANAPSLQNEILGFVIEKEIGQGSSGKVYKAANSETGKVVAIKVLHDYLASDKESLARFIREAALMRRMSSPQTIVVQSLNRLGDGRPYIVMEYVEGVSAASQILAEPMPADRAVSIFIQIASGLAHAHSLGIVHRDIKPSNIMLIEENGMHDTVKIVDFGSAKRLTPGEETTLQLTRTGEAVGSPVYMSPEQCCGGTIDHRTDIYSLGCVMYEMLTGRAVFTAKDIVELMNKQVKEKPAPMSLPPSYMVGELNRIIFKALAKDPAQRYQQAIEMKHELEQVMIISNVVASLVLH